MIIIIFRVSLGHASWVFLRNSEKFGMQDAKNRNTGLVPGCSRNKKEMRQQALSCTRHLNRNSGI